MKGLILSGGKGTRLRPITYTGAKQLVPVANKPVLFYAIEDLVEAGINDIGIVVGDTKDQIMAAVGNGRQFDARITYIEQEAPLGIAHGVKIAESFLGKERFVLFLGDNFIRDGIVPLVRRFEDDSLNCQILLYQVKNPQDFGVAELRDGRVVRLVEKPKEPKSDLAVIGIYMFDHHVFEAVHNIKPSARNELEITDTIQYLIDKGYTVHPEIISGWWIDTGKKDDLLEANRLILETFDTTILGSIDQKSQVYGKVVIQEGAEIKNSVLRGPIIIGEGTQISNSYIGPFTSIYHHCFIADSEIEHSIVLENSRIIDIHHRIEDSLIGRNVEISKSPTKPKAYKMMLGDYSKVGII
ncbi:MAG: glucose-1-phosphate thymidylyltransferase [Chloroflexi bacterium]|nr:glucose-1-phosphate thymidylyltransferase [Chloroflexota bacterium]MCL5074364.1 glucose-1-phosphate thymidylyltransferase [Chloroflexota bacterium]